MWKKLMKELNLSDSYISMGLGLLVVLVIGVLIFNYFSGKSAPSITETGEQTEEQKAEAALGKLPATYTTTEGDTLWSISEKYFKSGYNWVDIAKANNLMDANLIETGQKLTIPVVTPILAEETSVPAAEVKVDTSNIPDTYTVKAGDDLWDIAINIYQDGYRWVDIAKVNNLANPDIIHSGNVLTLPK